MKKKDKIIPPINATFEEILQRVADGHGAKKRVSKKMKLRTSNLRYK